MLVAGAALSLLQTAVSALKPDTPSDSTPFDAQPKPSGKSGGHPAGKVGKHLSDALQATLTQVSEQAGASSAVADIGRALKAYGRK